MKSKVWIICVGILMVFNCEPLMGQAKFKTIYSFGANNGNADGFRPQGPFVFDKAGHLFGTTQEGGTNLYAGTVFELSYSNNQWNHSVLYNFCPQADCADGSNPSEGVIVDAVGNLFGTTWLGGVPCQGTETCGVVFELSPPSKPDGTWTESVLWAFGSSPNDGCFPIGPVTLDAQGNLYGTAAGCGLYAQGVVFRLSPPTLPGETWTETILHDFCSNNVHENCFDGAEPKGSLALDAAGNVYGTTYKGGDNSGVVFELSPPISGDSWTETVLYKFRLNRGGNPITGVTFDQFGNLYGGLFGEHAGVGGYFKLTPTGIESQFEFKPGDGPAEGAPLIVSGTLYGENAYGYGQLLSIRGKTETILHTFCTQQPPPNCSDGIDPWSPLVRYGDRLYGTTLEGGDFGGGTVYEISR